VSELLPVAAALGMMTMIITGVTVLVRYQMRKQEAAEDAWEELRGRLGLGDSKLKEVGSPFAYSERGMDGEYDGVKLGIRVVHSPTDATKYTTEGMAELGRSLPLEIRKRGIFTGPSSAATGDAAFDAVFRVETTDPAVALEVLTPSARAAFLKLREHSTQFEFDGRKLSFREAGDWHEVERAEAVIVAMTAAIHALRGASFAEPAQGPSPSRPSPTGVVLPEFDHDESEPPAHEEERAQEAQEVAQNVK
jgi:hypothetical protein